MSAIDLKDDGLKEYSYVFFANGAKVMTREFDKFLPDLIPHLLEVIGESELTYIGRHDEVAMYFNAHAASLTFI